MARHPVLGLIATVYRLIPSRRFTIDFPILLVAIAFSFSAIYAAALPARSTFQTDSRAHAPLSLDLEQSQARSDGVASAGSAFSREDEEPNTQESNASQTAVQSEDFLTAPAEPAETTPPDGQPAETCATTCAPEPPYTPPACGSCQQSLPKSSLRYACQTMQCAD
jgi:hypothetical protein